MTENITIDGVVDLSGDWFHPADGSEEESDLLEVLQALDATADGMLLGRHTFEAFRAHWPLQADDPTGISDYLNRVVKYVVSSTLDDPAWENTEVIKGALTHEVQALKSRPGTDIVCTGSITLAQALIAAGLVDEYRLFVYPVVVGQGKRLFADATTVPKLALVESQAFRSGVMLLVYRPLR